jgi:hypothetical protein
MTVLFSLLVLAVLAVVTISLYLATRVMPDEDLVYRIRRALDEKCAVFIGWPLRAPESWRLARSIREKTIEMNDGRKVPLARLSAFIAADRNGLIVDSHQPIDPLPPGLQFPAEYVDERRRVRQKPAEVEPPKPIDENDPYAVLGLERGASIEAVRKAFLSATKEWHPSRFASNPEPEQKRANEKFLRIKKAHDVLIDRMRS